MASQARVRLLVPANATVAVTTVTAKARNFEKKEFITENTASMAVIAMSMPAFSADQAQSRSRAGLSRRPGRGGRCRHGRSQWERIIGSDLTRTALRVFQIVNLDQRDPCVIASAVNNRGIISRRYSRDDGCFAIIGGRESRIENLLLLSAAPVVVFINQ